MIKLLPHGPKNQTPKRIIVHAMGQHIVVGDDIMFAPDFLDHMGLSAHLLVDPSGELIRCRNDGQGAWHAKGFNTDSLGIEFLVEGVHDYKSFLKAIQENYITQKQWVVGVAAINQWMGQHNIKMIDRHSDVDPDRKKDPGSGFDWEGLLDTLDYEYECINSFNDYVDAS